MRTVIFTLTRAPPMEEVKDVVFVMNGDNKLIDDVITPFTRSISSTFSMIWSKVIPPSMSFLSWRILHNKTPIDEYLTLMSLE